MVSPGVKVPQFMELRGMVHALLEYTPKFAEVDTVLAEDTVSDVVTTEKVISVKAIAIMANATVISTHKNPVFHLKSFFKKGFPLSRFFCYPFRNLMMHQSNYLKNKNKHFL